MDKNYNKIYVIFQYIALAAISFYDINKNPMNIIYDYNYNTDNPSVGKKSLDEICLDIDQNAIYIRGCFNTNTITDNTQLYYRYENNKVDNINNKVSLIQDNYIGKTKTDNISSDITYNYWKYVRNDNGYIHIVNHNGNQYATSDLIKLYKGDTIYVRAIVKSPGVVAFVSKWEDENTPIQALKIASSDYMEDFTYTVIDDIEFIRICYYCKESIIDGISSIDGILPYVAITKNLDISDIKYTVNDTANTLSQLQNQIGKYENQLNNYLAYCIRKVLFIGDSLTAGSTYAEAWGEMNSGATGSIDDNIPRMFKRMLNCDICDNASIPGYSASDWWNRYNELDVSNYDTFFIWLGTNYGPITSLETDVDPYEDYNDFAETETGYYCRIIEKIKAENNSCLIVLVKVFASKSNVTEINSMIDNIAEKYNLVVIDNSDLTTGRMPKLHADINNPHFCKNGNAFIANRYIQELTKYFAQDPMRCEYHYVVQTNII